MIITSHFITLDGVIASPEQWHPAFASPESMDVMLAQLRRADGMLVGRRTFAEFASWWPDQGDEVPAAKETNAIPKYVVSSTLESPAWGPTEVLSDGPVQAVRTLDERGLTVFLPGSAELTGAVLAAGLVDEMQFYLDPVVLGEGLRLFGDERGQIRLELDRCTPLPHGVLHLVYRTGSRR